MFLDLPVGPDVGRNGPALKRGPSSISGFSVGVQVSTKLPLSPLGSEGEPSLNPLFLEGTTQKQALSRKTAEGLFCVYTQ